MSLRVLPIPDCLVLFTISTLSSQLLTTLRSRRPGLLLLPRTLSLANAAARLCAHLSTLLLPIRSVSPTPVCLSPRDRSNRVCLVGVQF